VQGRCDWWLSWLGKVARGDLGVSRAASGSWTTVGEAEELVECCFQQVESGQNMIELGMEVGQVWIGCWWWLAEL